MAELVPTGTVTLLLADVDGSTRLWQSQPQEMTSAFAALERAVTNAVATHHGVRTADGGGGDNFVIAFGRASDAVACALDLQCAPLAPIRLRIGVHTGEVQLRDEANYIGPTIKRTARLRDLAHGGQTVLSGATEPLVLDRLSEGAWLTDLGTHPLRDLPRPERVVQLCHPDLRNEFPPLRVTGTVGSQHLPVQLTSFVGRGAQIIEVRGLLADNRLVTLTGAGGAGKTRLAVQVAGQLAGESGDGVWFVDLAPIADAEIVVVTVARALGLPDQPGCSTMDTLTRFIDGRRMLVVLDNCEHLLDASAALVNALVGACPGLTLLTTSREPIGIAGEVSWRVPSLSLGDEAIELFTDRARRARPDFAITEDTAAVVVSEICRRLDGMPLAIELAAARVRALSLGEILAGLQDRFRLLTRGARTAVRRQQTLRSSVDWSHALLSEPERVLFRRVGVFSGGFDLDGAQAVAGSGEVARYQVLDQLSLLVDKSLVIAEEGVGRMRYRLLETVRQYALEKLGESGEAEAVRARHRDHYTTLAARLAPAQAGHEQPLEQAETEIDNLRAAFGCSWENSDIELALQLASSLQPLWLGRGRVREGLAWFNTALADDNEHPEVARAVRARALADTAVLAGVVAPADSMERAQQALAIARDIGDPALLTRALTVCASSAAYNAELARPYFAEAIEHARALGDRRTLSHILGWQANTAFNAGDPIAARAAAEEGRALAEAIGDGFLSRRCRWAFGAAQYMSGDLAAAVAHFRELVVEAETTHDRRQRWLSLVSLGFVQAYHGDTAAARAAAAAALEGTADVGGFAEGVGYVTLALAALAGGDLAAAHDASQAAWQQQMSGQPEAAAMHVHWMAEVALAHRDLKAARRWADDAVAVTTGWHLMLALTTRARVAIAQGAPQQAQRDAHDALTHGADVQAYLGVSDTLECLATVAGEAGSHQEAARLFGAAAAIQQRMGAVRFKIYDTAYQSSAAAVRNTLGEDAFERAWAEGAALSTEEAIAYAQRGRGERKRPAGGWESLTPTERDVVRLVSEGLTNNDVATRLFVSPRTVQTHLTHVYTKLGLTSRVQLVQEAARHA